MAGAVGCSAGALHRRAFAIVLHVTAERSLVYLAVLGAGKRNTVMLQLVDRLWRFHRQILHGINIAQPVRTLHRVIHVPLPAVRRHIGERGGNAALRGNGVRTGREDLCDTGGSEPLFGHAERGAKSGATCTDNHDVVGVIDNLVGPAVYAGRGSLLGHSVSLRMQVAVSRRRW